MLNHTPKENGTMAKPAEDKGKKFKLDGMDPEKVKEELLSTYPTKVARKRAKQIIDNIEV